MPIENQKLASEKIISKQSRFVNKDDSELVLVVKRKFPFGNWICHQAIENHIDQKTGFTKPNGYKRSLPRALASEAEKDYQKILKRLSSNGFKMVDSSVLPKNAYEGNWDFISNIPKSLSNFCKNAEKEFNKESFSKISQSNQWYSGNFPDPKSLAGYVGSSSLDASQLQGSFGGVNEAIQLVNQFDSSLLRNVAFIFNTTGGAYGVYVPWLDEQIKNEEIKSVLKSSGFEIEDSKEFFTAYSKNPKMGETEIANEISRVKSRIHMQGGNTFGINMSKILSAARSDAQESGLTDPQDLYDITVLHLGSTMVHEAVHAKGSTSEGPSEQAEARFTQWALGIINERRFKRQQAKGDGAEYSPLISNQNNRRSWYDSNVSGKIERKAQFGAQFPINNFSEGIAPWGMVFNGTGSDSIEQRLYVQRKGTKPGSLEGRLRNQVRYFPDVNPSEITEMLLEKDHDEFSSYKSIEDLLEDLRPKPLAILVNKVANTIKMTRTADESYNSTFGWMNNLDLPMAERIITEEQSDDFLNFDWKKMRRQPRYNPEYDRYGVYYRWNEPRMNSPELFDRMIAERPGSTSAALRFASDDLEEKEVVDVLFSTLELIKSGEIGGTRFLVGDKVIFLIDKFFKDKNEISLYSFPPIGEYKGEDIYPIWIIRESIPEKAVIISEDYISGKNDDSKAGDVFEHITGLSKQRKKVIDNVLSEVTEASFKMGLEDLFIIGAFPRAFLSKESWANVFDLDFVSSSPQECLKLGSFVANKIGAGNVEIDSHTSTLTWYYKGLKCDFRGNYMPQKTIELMNESKIEISPVNLEVYSKDFTINMLGYKISDGVVYDISDKSAKDIQYGIIRTYFDPERMILNSPIIILRAIKYACRYGFKIENELKEAIIKNTSLLLNCEESRLFLALIEIIREGSKKSEEMINEYGLQWIYEIKDFKD